jgi:tetratricopeptide (TPR) repeat protein
LADANRAIKIDPRVNHFYYLRGRIHGQKKDYERAMADFAEGIRVSPESEKFQGFNVRADFSLSLGRIEQAIDDYTEVIRLRGKNLEPAHATLYATRANLFLAHAETDRALADFDEAIRLDPKPGGVYYNRGLAHVRKRQWDRALADFHEVTRRSLSDKFWAGAGLQSRADCLAMAGRIEQAEQAYQECLKLDPGRGHQVLVSRAWSIDRPRGDYDAALEKLDLVAAHSGMIFQFLERGLIHMRLGKPDSALADFNEVLNRVKARPDWFTAPDYHPRWLALMLGRGEAYLLKGDLDRAMADGNEAVRFAPRSAEARLLRARVYEKRGKADLAEDDRREAARLEPDPMLAMPEPRSPRGPNQP